MSDFPASGPTILHESARFVAADKPPGWLSVPSRWGARDERPVVGLFVQERLGSRLWPVHRLDEEASGLLLFARDAEAHAAASRWFEERLVAKTYHALTEQPASGAPPEGFRATWRSRLLRGKKRAHESPVGKDCETAVRFLGVLRHGERECLAWELQPVTGRPHQLRWELAHHGFPILGDRLYGAQASFEAGIALRCVRLGFASAPEAAGMGLPPVLEAPPLVGLAAT